MTTAKADQTPPGYIRHKRRKGMVKADTPTALAVLTALRIYRVSMVEDRGKMAISKKVDYSDSDPINLYIDSMVNQYQQQIEAIDRLCASVTKPAYSEAVVKACREWAENYLLTIK